MIGLHESYVTRFVFQDSAEMIRSFAGGLELLISLLKSNDIRVLSCVCAAIAEVAKNDENLAVITDLSVVDNLANLVSTVIA